MKHWLPQLLTGKLHPYQAPAVEQFLARDSLLIAYEMGLGKTICAIACAEELLGCRDVSVVLLVVPASLIYQWAQALAEFTDLPRTTKRLKLNGKWEKIIIPAEPGCVIVLGSKQRKISQLTKALAAEYVIMSYETVVKQARKVKRLKPELVILDEASAIKTFGSDRTLTVKRVLTPEYRIALTGTPVENRPEEAFSIMEWVDEDVLGPFDLFEKSFIERSPSGQVDRYKNLPALHRRMSRAMARARRSDPGVREYLPAVTHDTWYVDMDDSLKSMYSQIADDLLDELDKLKPGSFDMASYYSGGKPDESTGLGRVMARQQALEMLLDHPGLVAYSMSKYAGELQLTDIFAGLWPTPKKDFLVQRLQEITEFPGNKVLVFTRYLSMVSYIETTLQVQCGIPCVTYSGEMSPSQKAAAVHSFAATPELQVFVSSHAGAYGCDMKMANYLVNYDLPWSGGMSDQINARHQRVSSEFDRVYVSDLIMRGTIEERKLAMLDHKRRVAAAIVDGRSPKSGVIQNDLVGLADFLRAC